MTNEDLILAIEVIEELEERITLSSDAGFLDPSERQ